MRIRTFLGILLALLVVVAASYLTHQNRDLLHTPFHLTGERTVPLYGVILAVFLLGFLPTITVLLVQGVRRDLARRRDRRSARETESLNARFRRAVDLQADGQWSRAAAELEGVLAERPDDFAALLRYGEVLRHLGRVDEAVEVHRRLSVLYPHSVAVLYQLAEDYETRGEPEVAREIRNRVRRDFPNLGFQILRRRRNAALAARNWGEAARLQGEIDALLQEAGETVEQGAEEGIRRGLLYQRAVELLERDEAEEATGILQDLLAQEPRFIPAAILLGEARLLQEDEEGALSQWLQGYETTGSPVFLQRIEDHFIESEKPLRAIETLRQLIAQAANDLLPRFFLGRLYYRLEMLEEALKVLEGLEDRIRSSPTYHFLLARIHERRGEMKRAVECYQACARELGVAAREFRCRVCDATYGEWQDRCHRCGSWNAVELDFQEERISPDELGVREAPVWGSYDDDEEWDRLELADEAAPSA